MTTGRINQVTTDSWPGSQTARRRQGESPDGDGLAPIWRDRNGSPPVSPRPVTGTERWPTDQIQLKTPRGRLPWGHDTKRRATWGQPREELTRTERRTLHPWRIP